MTPTNISFGPLANTAMLHPSGLHVGLATLGVVTLQDHSELSHLLPPLISHFESHGFKGPKPVMDEILRANGNIRFEYWGQVGEYLKAVYPPEFQLGITARLDLVDPASAWHFPSHDPVAKRKAQSIYSRNREGLNFWIAQATQTEILIHDTFHRRDDISLQEILRVSPAKTAAKLFKRIIPMYQDDDWVRFLNAVKNLCSAGFGEDWHKKNFDREEWPSQLHQCTLLYKVTVDNTPLFVQTPSFRYQGWFDAQQQLMGCITTEAKTSLVERWKKQFHPFLNEISIDPKEGKVEISVQLFDAPGKIGDRKIVEASDADILERLPYTAKSWFYAIFGLSIQPPSPRKISADRQRTEPIAKQRHVTAIIDDLHSHRPGYSQWKRDFAKYTKINLRLVQGLTPQHGEETDEIVDAFLHFGSIIVNMTTQIYELLATGSEEAWEFWSAFVPLLNRHITLPPGKTSVHISQAFINMLREPKEPNDIGSLLERLKTMPPNPNYTLNAYDVVNGILVVKAPSTPKNRHNGNSEAAKARAEKSEVRWEEKRAKARAEAASRAKEVQRLAVLRDGEEADAAAEEETRRIEALCNQAAAASQAAAEAEEKQRKQHFSVFQSHGTRFEKLIDDIEVMLLELCDAGKVSEEDLGASWFSLNGDDKKIPLAPELKRRRENLRGDFEKALRSPLSTTNGTAEILKSSHALLETAMAAKRDIKEAAKSR